MTLPAIGDYLESQGGWLGAYISLDQDGNATHALIVVDQAQEFVDTAGSVSPTTPSLIDGPANFAELLSQSISPAVEVQTTLNDASHGGYDDWYIPAFYELAALYVGLKPTDSANSTSHGINPYSVPKRESNYSASDPGQTGIALFQSGGAQAFSVDQYHSSSFTASQTAQRLDFGNGQQLSGNPSFSHRYRAIRRVAVSEIVAQPPSAEEAFQASFEDASGRDPLPTALVDRTPARQLANHLVTIYRYPPYRVVKRLPVPPEKYDRCQLGMDMWHQDNLDPLFAMGRWAQIEGFRLFDDANMVEFDLRISDHPESFIP